MLRRESTSAAAQVKLRPARGARYTTNMLGRRQAQQNYGGARRRRRYPHSFDLPMPAEHGVGPPPGPPLPLHTKSDFPRKRFCDLFSPSHLPFVGEDGAQVLQPRRLFWAVWTGCSARPRCCWHMHGVLLAACPPTPRASARPANDTASAQLAIYGGRKRNVAYGKRSIVCNYSHNAPALECGATGLTAHPGKIASGLEKQARGKKTVQKDEQPPMVFATYLCPDQLREQRAASAPAFRFGRRPKAGTVPPKQLGSSMAAGCQFGSAVHAVPPAGWQTVQSRTTGKSYFFNAETGESRWKPPPDEDDLVPTARPCTSALRGVAETRDGMLVIYDGSDDARNIRRGGTFKPQLPRHGDSRNRTTPFNPFREELPPKVRDVPTQATGAKDSKV